MSFLVNLMKVEQIMATTQEIYDEMSKFIIDSKIAVSSWYVGIAADLKDALFTRHKVDEKKGTYIGIYTSSDKNARAIEKALVKKHKTQGGGGGGDTSTKGVYAYVITSTTSED